MEVLLEVMDFEPGRRVGPDEKEFYWEGALSTAGSVRIASVRLFSNFFGWLILALALYKAFLFIRWAVENP